MKSTFRFVPLMRILVIIVLSLAWFSCKSPDPASLDPKEFDKRLSGGNVQLLDVRTPEEYAEGHIANSVNMNIKRPDFEKQAEGLYRDVPVYVYCRSGSRSSNAADKLRSLGFRQVLNLKGGIEQWKAEGLPVVVPEAEIEEEKPDFKTAIQGEKLVLVDFNATWCGPCKMMQPFVDRMERNRRNEVTVISIDTDAERELAMEYGITQLPTLMLFRKGKVLDKTIGYMDEQKLNAFVDKHL